MYRTIVVPLDGSPLAERALPYVAALARPVDARVVLVRAVLAHTLPGTDPSAAQLEVVQRAEQELDTVVAYLQGMGVRAEPHVYYDEAATAIVDIAAAQHADLIVMSTHGRGGLGRWVYGSVAERVLEHAVPPVLLVPAKAPPALADPPLRVVVPLDGSPLAEAVLEPLRALAAGRAADLLLLRVVEPPAPLVAEEVGYAAVAGLDDEVEEAGRYLERIASGLRAHRAVATTAAVIGEPAETIARIAMEEQAGLVAMATHGRGGLARLVVGSVAAGVLHRLAVPLLLVRPAAVAAAPLPTRAAADADTQLVALSADERALVRAGLRALLQDVDHEVGGRARQSPTERAAADLLARLTQTETAALPAGR